jgi:hypothetical protein
MILLNFIRKDFLPNYSNIGRRFSWMNSYISTTTDSTSECNNRHVALSRSSK